MEFLKRRNGLATAIQKENMNSSLALTRAETCIGPPKLWNRAYGTSDLYWPSRLDGPSLDGIERLNALALTRAETCIGPPKPWNRAYGTRPVLELYAG